MSILVDGGGILEGLDLGVDLVVDQDVEEGVCLGGRERGGGGRHGVHLEYAARDMVEGSWSVVAAI